MARIDHLEKRVAELENQPKAVLKQWRRVPWFP